MDLHDPLLGLAADVLDDLERVRIANENRLRQLTRTETDVDGEDRGFGLDESHPDVARLAALVAALAKAEHDAELQLCRQMRAHPLGPWVKSTIGVGEKQAARLLAAIGDPYWNDLHDRPRTVSELWAYSGYHVLRTGQGRHDAHDGHAGAGPTPVGHSSDDSHLRVADGPQLRTGQGDHGHHSTSAGAAGSDLDQVRFDVQSSSVGVAATPRRGQRANWSADAKMRAHLIAVSCLKTTDSPYRPVYDAGREKYAGAVHPAECRRCGPSGSPAPAGSPLSAGHQHARAIRLMAKAILRDLWIEARRLHGDESLADTG